MPARLRCSAQVLACDLRFSGISWRRSGDPPPIGSTPRHHARQAAGVSIHPFAILKAQGKQSPDLHRTRLQPFRCPPGGRSGDPPPIRSTPRHPRSRTAGVLIRPSRSRYSSWSLPARLFADGDGSAGVRLTALASYTLLCHDVRERYKKMRSSRRKAVGFFYFGGSYGTPTSIDQPWIVTQSCSHLR